jgi:hypothetical protein
MNTKKKLYDVAIIGAGIFGAEIAIKAKEAGLSSILLEAKNDILQGASKNNQNRLHLGFHYPRDIETGRQCIKGFNAFKDKYSDCINDNFINAYFVSSNNSFVTSEQFQNHAIALDVPFKEINLKDFPLKIDNVNYGIECEEVVYDCSILRDLVKSHLKLNHIEISLNHKVDNVSKNLDLYKICSSKKSPIYAKSVINCSYSDINFITNQLGFEASKNQYEYTVVPIVELDIPKVGVTVMDGPFMTLLPYGKSNDFLLYHVENSVIARENSIFFNQSWGSPKTAPFKEVDKKIFFNKIIKDSMSHLSFLKKAKLKGFLEGPRMVLSKNDKTDARPSIVKKYDETYITVFSGKIDHSIWVAEDVIYHLKKIFN